MTFRSSSKGNHLFVGVDSPIVKLILISSRFGFLINKTTIKRLDSLSNQSRRKPFTPIALHLYMSL